MLTILLLSLNYLKSSKEARNGAKQSNPVEENPKNFSCHSVYNSDPHNLNRNNFADDIDKKRKTQNLLYKFNVDSSELHNEKDENNTKYCLSAKLYDPEASSLCFCDYLSDILDHSLSSGTKQILSNVLNRDGRNPRMILQCLCGQLYEILTKIKSRNKSEISSMNKERFMRMINLVISIVSCFQRKYSEIAKEPCLFFTYFDSNAHSYNDIIKSNLIAEKLSKSSLASDEKRNLVASLCDLVSASIHSNFLASRKLNEPIQSNKAFLKFSEDELLFLCLFFSSELIKHSEDIKNLNGCEYILRSILILASNLNYHIYLKKLDKNESDSIKPEKTITRHDSEMIAGAFFGIIFLLILYQGLSFVFKTLFG